MHPTLTAVGLTTVRLRSRTVSHARASPALGLFGDCRRPGVDRASTLSEPRSGHRVLSPPIRAADKSTGIFRLPPKIRNDSTSPVITGYQPSGPDGSHRELCARLRVGRSDENIGERLGSDSEVVHISVDPSGRCGTLTAIPTTDTLPRLIRSCPTASWASVPASSGTRVPAPTGTRQESAHPHSINVDPSGTLAIVGGPRLVTRYLFTDSTPRKASFP